MILIRRLKKVGAPQTERFNEKSLFEMSRELLAHKYDKVRNEVRKLIKRRDQDAENLSRHLKQQPLARIESLTRGARKRRELDVANARDLARSLAKQQRINSHIRELQIEHGHRFPGRMLVASLDEQGQPSLKAVVPRDVALRTHGSKMWEALHPKPGSREDGPSPPYTGIGKYYRRRKAYVKKPVKKRRYKKRKNPYHEALRKAYAEIIGSRIAPMDMDPIDELIVKFEKKRSAGSGISPPRKFKLEDEFI